MKKIICLSFILLTILFTVNVHAEDELYFNSDFIYRCSEASLFVPDDKGNEIEHSTSDYKRIYNFKLLLENGKKTDNTPTETAISSRLVCPSKTVYFIGDNHFKVDENYYMVKLNENENITSLAKTYITEDDAVKFNYSDEIIDNIKSIILTYADYSEMDLSNPDSKPFGYKQTLTDPKKIKELIYLINGSVPKANNGLIGTATSSTTYEILFKDGSTETFFTVAAFYYSGGIGGYQGPYEVNPTEIEKIFEGLEKTPFGERAQKKEKAENTNTNDSNQKENPNTGAFVPVAGLSLILIAGVVILKTKKHRFN